MKRIVIVSALLLAACGGGGGRYEPKLAHTPSNTAKYESDLTSCYSQSDKRIAAVSEKHKNDVAIPLFGLIGYGVGAANADKDDAYYMSFGEVVDECFAKRGYQLTN